MNSAVVYFDDNGAVVVAVGLTVREAHANIRRRRAANPTGKYAIVFDAGYAAGDEYVVEGRAA